MAEITLVTGGTRSGKSAYAQGLAESLPEPRTYLATCVPEDEEMKDRVRQHQAARRQASWRTIEEAIAVAAVLEKIDSPVVLIDCIVLWVSNLMQQAKADSSPLGEKTVADRAQALAKAANARDGHVILVTAEVGLGIIPNNASARMFCDLLGVCNQTLAAIARTVTLVSCGLPMHLKKVS